ncbi:TPA: dihydrodipicolinate synthase family protein [Candidatus Poribacteria bacterium]|jgi:4-hydroxy-tetrahydrodipicolinate synthase|nr:dihydrodipicolinate synthase family protein [Candidatus Poribacteria bacterium]
MNTKTIFSGIVCPILTPFNTNGEVDIEALKVLVDFLIDHGIETIMTGGTTGEGMLLSLDERKIIAETVVKKAKNRCHVVIHTGFITTAGALELTRHAKAIGAEGASIITPYFYSYNDEALFNYYKIIADEVPDFPIALYSFPGNAKQHIHLNLFKRLISDLPNIVALKLSDPNLILLQEYIQTGGPDFSVLCGVDALMLPALSVGAKGEVSGNANVFPEVFIKLYNSYMQGDLAEAQKQQILINKIRAVFKDELAYFKAAISLRGIPVGDPRPPISKLTNQELAEMKAGLAELHLL